MHDYYYTPKNVSINDLILTDLIEFGSVKHQILKKEHKAFEEVELTLVHTNGVGPRTILTVRVHEGMLVEAFTREPKVN